MLGRDAGEVLLAPLDQRPDAVEADVAVGAGELGGAGDAEAVLPEAAGDDLRLVVEQADPGRRRLARGVVEVRR